MSHTPVYVHGFCMRKNFVPLAKSTKYTKLNRVRNFCDYSITNNVLEFLDENVNAHLPYYSTLKKFWNGFFQMFQAGLVFFSALLLRVSVTFSCFTVISRQRSHMYA